MNTNEAGAVLLAATGVARMALLHPLLLFVPASIAVVLFFVGASDMPTDPPGTDTGP